MRKDKDKEIVLDPVVIDLLEGMTDEDIEAMKAAIEDINNE